MRIRCEEQSVVNYSTPYCRHTTHPLPATLHFYGLREHYEHLRPTLCSSPEVKGQFYEDLDAVIGMVPDSEPLFLLGDFNARVGGDHESLPDCIGHFGDGRMNENGQRLLELCSYRKLSISNTFFNTKLHHRVS